MAALLHDDEWKDAMEEIIRTIAELHHAGTKHSALARLELLSERLTLDRRARDEAYYEPLDEHGRTQEERERDDAILARISDPNGPPIVAEPYTT